MTEYNLNIYFDASGGLLKYHEILVLRAEKIKQFISSCVNLIVIYALP